MAKSRSKLRNVVEYGLMRAGLTSVALLPERPAYWLVGAVGRLFFRCSKRRQALALRFLRTAYPEGKTDAELLELGRVSAGNIFKVSLDMVWGTRAIRRGTLTDAVDLSTARGRLGHRPLLIVAAHGGSWEIGAMAVGLTIGEAHTIARAFKNPLIQRFLLESRRAAGLHIHPKRGGIRPLVRALKDDNVCMAVVDQHQRLRGLQVPFFGRMASTERSAATLAVRAGCSVVVGHCPRIGPGFRFRLEISEPLPIEITGDRDADIARAAAVVNRGLEEAILTYPDQYLWMHNRYRDEPKSSA